MPIRNLTPLLLGLVLLILPACGGGGGTDTAALEPMNASEKSLVGAYDLTDFLMFEPGFNPHEPSGFEVWGGSMELRDDRTATVTMQFCENAGDPTAGCEREFVWTADTGLIYLQSMDAIESNVLLEWQREGMGTVTTCVCLPTNDPTCGLLLLEDGHETFEWERID